MPPVGSPDEIDRAQFFHRHFPVSLALAKVPVALDLERSDQQRDLKAHRQYRPATVITLFDRTEDLYCHL